MAVNINGQFYCTRLAVPLLKAAGGGLIVNLSSAAGLFGFPNRTPYAASKWAVIGFSKSLAMELGERQDSRQCDLSRHRGWRTARAGDRSQSRG